MNVVGQRSAQLLRATASNAAGACAGRRGAAARGRRPARGRCRRCPRSRMSLNLPPGEMRRPTRSGPMRAATSRDQLDDEPGAALGDCRRTRRAQRWCWCRGTGGSGSRWHRAARRRPCRPRSHARRRRRSRRSTARISSTVNARGIGRGPRPRPCGRRSSSARHGARRHRPAAVGQQGRMTDAAGVHELAGRCGRPACTASATGPRRPAAPGCGCPGCRSSPDRRHTAASPSVTISRLRPLPVVVDGVHRRGRRRRRRGCESWGPSRHGSPR